MLGSAIHPVEFQGVQNSQPIQTLHQSHLVNGLPVRGTRANQMCE